MERRKLKKVNEQLNKAQIEQGGGMDPDSDGNVDPMPEDKPKNKIKIEYNPEF